MRGEIIYKILDFIEDASLSAIDLTSAFLRAGYGASMSKIEYEDRLLNISRENYKFERAEKRHLQVYIAKLKNQGLLIENSSNKIILSKKGKKKLKLLKRKKIFNPNSYSKAPGDKVIIISYDLPISFNYERNLLRDILRILGFNMVHKSVWIGKVKIPKEFIDALQMLGILRFVEILEVTKKGTLKEI